MMKQQIMNQIPTITKNLLIINVLMLLATHVAGSYGIDLERYLALHFFLSDDFNAAQLLTYQFMHAGFTHLFFNMFALWMFGRILEQMWGPQRFLFYYLLCGVGAGLIQETVQYANYLNLKAALSPEAIEVVFREGAGLLHKGMNYVDPALGAFNAALNGGTVGASGAVYAILLGFGMMFPNQEMFVFPLPFPIKAKYFVIGYAVIELSAGLANRTGDPVAHFAHLGGMVFGFILITYWRKKNRGNGYYYN